MCVAIPGTVLEVRGDMALVDFSGNRVKARAGYVSIQPGDRVLVHAGCILQKVDSREADEIEALFAELEAMR